MQTELYNHHGRNVHVNKEFKGKHIELCLCYSCEKLKPGEEDNCPAAQKLYELCVEGPITVAPVLECSSFERAA